MKPANEYSLVLVTVPDIEKARTIACDLLQKRLIACVNIIPEVESHYWWQNNIESGRECLLLMKTHSDKLKALERAILELHPYSVPEILAIELHQGLEKYLQWIDESLSHRD